MQDIQQQDNGIDQVNVLPAEDPAISQLQAGEKKPDRKAHLDDNFAATKSLPKRGQEM
jgi:hypothetical protein